MKWYKIIALVGISTFLSCNAFSQNRGGQYMGYTVQPVKMVNLMELCPPAPPSRNTQRTQSPAYDNSSSKNARTLNSINQIKSYYKTLSPYPIVIPDGYYSVVFTNDYDICENANVVVKNNSIVSFYYDSSNFIIEAEYGIKKGVALIKLANNEGYFHLYFIEYLSKGINQQNVKPNLRSGVKKHSWKEPSTKIDAFRRIQQTLND